MKAEQGEHDIVLLQRGNNSSSSNNNSVLLRTSASQITSTTHTSTTTSVNMRRSNGGGGTGTGSQLQRLWVRLEGEWKSIPWDRLRSIKWKNERAAPGCAYKPTEIEHVANILSHGIWVIPAIYAALQLLYRSQSSAQALSAVIYGCALASLFVVSTCFHGACYCHYQRNIRDVLHRCDRAMIYVFIAGSYFPWLSLGHPAHPIICGVFKWAIWVLAALGILYQQLYHEKFKTLETIFYVIMGVGPSVVIMLYGHEFTGMGELKLGGLLYMIGVGFFKSDGILPFAHSIWHLFVVCAASVHYYAILNYLYPYYVTEPSIP